MEERQFVGIFIPAKLYLDKNLSWIEKILIVEVESLTSEKEPCKATNEHFAQHLGISKDRVSKIISSLVKRGYLHLKIKYSEDKKQVQNRYLLVDKTYSYFQLEGIVKNTDTPIGENDEENKVNKNNNTSLKVSTDVYKEIIDYMNTINEHDNFEIKIPFFYKYTSKDTQSHINARIRDGYDIEDFKDVIYWGYFKFVENQFQTETEGTSVKYFRPSTLFSDKHFGEYLNEYRARTSK